jgi:hypothetical protein
LKLPPVKLTLRQGSDTWPAHPRPCGRDRDPDNGKHCGLPVTPLSHARWSSRPEALRPRLTTGLPLRCGLSKPNTDFGRNCLSRQTVGCCNGQKRVGSPFYPVPCARVRSRMQWRGAIASLCGARGWQKDFLRLDDIVRRVSVWPGTRVAKNVSFYLAGVVMSGIPPGFRRATTRIPRCARS